MNPADFLQKEMADFSSVLHDNVVFNIALYLVTELAMYFYHFARMERYIVIHICITYLL